MKIGVLGAGMVGTAIASRLVELGHEVMLGTRDEFSEAAAGWVSEAGPYAATGLYADAASYGEMVFNCTIGPYSLAALAVAGAKNLEDKIIVDVANPLDYSRGYPPRFSVCNDDSLGETIQRAYPKSRVVKALNTVSSDLMAHPERLPGDHVVFVCGDDREAKARVSALLHEGFGWRRIIDLGDITKARGTEAYMALWVRLCEVLGTVDFNIELVTATKHAPGAKR